MFLGAFKIFKTSKKRKIKHHPKEHLKHYRISVLATIKQQGAKHFRLFRKSVNLC